MAERCGFSSVRVAGHILRTAWAAMPGRAKVRRALRRLRSSAGAARGGFVAGVAAFCWLFLTASARGGVLDAADDWRDEMFLLQAASASAALSAPLWVPFVAFDQGPYGTFLNYPYEDYDEGYMHFAGDTVAGKPFGGALLGELSLDGRVLRETGHVFVDSEFRLGLDAETTFFDGDYKGRSLDHVSTGDVNALVRFAQHRQVQFRVGAGMRWLDDDQGTDYGFNLTYAVDVQLLRPVIGGLTLDWGYLRDEEFFHGRLTVGAIWRRWEAYAGLDYLQLAGVYQAGPILGLRMWF